MDVLNTFIAVLLAFIVKDFYDIFIQSHIRDLMSKYKILITKREIKELEKWKIK